MAAADRANKFIDENAPWNLRGPEQAGRQLDVCTIGLNLFRQLAVYLAPVLPKMAKDVGEFLNDPITDWQQSQQPLRGHEGRQVPAPHAARRSQEGRGHDCRQRRAGSGRVEDASADAGVSPASAAAPQDSDAPLKAEPLTAECTMDDLAKVDLRVCRVLTAEEVPEAKKLLKLTISLGGDNRRTVFAGIKGYYQPEQLVGKLFICIANLAPRKMKFGLSEGMMLAAGGEGEAHLLVPDEGAKPGQTGALTSSPPIIRPIIIGEVPVVPRFQPAVRNTAGGGTRHFRGECHVTQDVVDGSRAHGRVRMDRRRKGRGTRYSRVAAGPGGESPICKRSR